MMTTSSSPLSEDAVEPDVTILCAIRGGPQSELTIKRAIELTQKHNAKLVLVHVLDIGFLEFATLGRPSVMLNELRATFEFLLESLTKQAINQDVHVEHLILTGNLRRQIIETVHQQDARVLVMGSPIKSPGKNTFTEKSFAQFLEEIEAETDVEIVVAESPSSGEPEGT